MKLVVCPVSFVCQLPSLIEKLSPSMHLIFFPLSIIISSVLIKKLASAMPQSILFKPFISTSSFILLYNKLDISLVLILGLGRLIRCFFINFNNCRVILIRISYCWRRSYLMRTRRTNDSLATRWRSWYILGIKTRLWRR